MLLFLGGWETGLGFPEAMLSGIRGVGQDVPIEGFVLGNYIANIFAAKVFILKASLLVFVQIWVRWTLPRLRIDQVMTTCLKYLVPISCCLFLGAVFWPLLLASSGLERPILFGRALVPPAVASAVGGVQSRVAIGSQVGSAVATADREGTR